MNDYDYYLNKTGEFGIVEEVNYPIIVVSGLPNAKPREVVMFENGQRGQVFTLEKDKIEVLLFSKEPVRVGDKASRTDFQLTVPVGPELLGNMIDPLCNPIINTTSFKRPTLMREMDEVPLGMSMRSRIKNSLLTGVSIVDIMVPLGKGQKELVIGDRKTGKSLFMQAMIKNQVQAGSIAIYAAIGKKRSDIKLLGDFFAKEGISNKICIVASGSDDSPSLIYLTPYVAMTIAEYFKDSGQDTVVVLDDLSTHAKFYREISLISRRFPGRDSYPGDIFYTHARLLERAGNFIHPTKGEVSISCFPVAETVEGDFTGYIATNLMGMTDGHIFFDSNVYYKGRRPAVNIFLSITRVGRQAQDSLKRSINRELTSFLSMYDRMQNLSHFGAELTEGVKHILSLGDKIYKLFDQGPALIIPSSIQMIMLTLIWLNIFQDETDEVIYKYRLNMIDMYSKNEKVKKMFDSIINVDSFNNLLSSVSTKKEAILSICKTEKA